MYESCYVAVEARSFLENVLVEQKACLGVASFVSKIVEIFCQYIRNCSETRCPLPLEFTFKNEAKYSECTRFLRFWNRI
jgi:hypothetical protein